MGDEDLRTIPEKESDKFIKSSVKDLVPILSESEDTSDNDSECDFPFCDDSFPLDVLGELHFEGLKVIKSYIPPDFKDNYYDSEGDTIYLKSLLINDTIPNLPPEVFFDHDPKRLKDKPDNDDLKSMVKVFDPGIHEKIISPTYVSYCPYYEDSHARGFVHRSLELQSLACLYMGIRYPRSY
ncbi:hypothetical protein Tco_0079001 [Tanacetum coccineum]